MRVPGIFSFKKMASDGGGSSNKAQKMDHESGGGGGGSGSVQTMLGHVFLREKGLIFNLVSFTSVPQTSRLLTTCTELYTAEKVVLQKLPKVCDMSSSRWGEDGNEFKLYGAIVVRAPNSRWLGWLDTSGVEELKLPQRVTDEEMLIMFGGERFSELQSLILLNCSKITDASVKSCRTPLVLFEE